MQAKKNLTKNELLFPIMQLKNLNLAATKIVISKPVQELFYKVQPSPMTLQPIERHMQPIGPLSRSLFQRRHHRHELPNLHKYLQWSFGP